MTDQQGTGTDKYDVSEIDDVLNQLDRIIERAIAEPNRIGYFAAMYRQVTAAVRQAILDDEFDDGQRMVTLDRVFAERFIDAHDTWRSGHHPSRSWQVAFDAARKRRLLILQQLLIGMNAHINLDLGIAAATVAPGAKLSGLKNDFGKINEVLEALSQSFESAIGDLSPWIGFLERLGGKADDVIVNFSIGIARREAWNLASELAPLPPVDQAPSIARCDETTSLLGNAVARPGILIPIALLAIRARESNDIAAIIRHLSQA